MADIKITLSTEPGRAPRIEDEAEWMEEEGSLFYRLAARPPKEAEPGCWVYMIRDKRLVARARAKEFRPESTVQKTCDYEGNPVEPKGAWGVECTDMEVIKDEKKRLPHVGFRGFRYVRPEERRAFEKAFV